MSHGSIYFFDQDISFLHPQQEIVTKWIEQTFNQEGQNWTSINIIFCSDDYLLQLNQQYLNHNYYTDILTFQYEQSPIEGELYISMDRVRANADDLAIDWPLELHRVIIHGILHLCGYGDKTNEEALIMKQKEDKYLSLLFTPPNTLTLDKF